MKLRSSAAILMISVTAVWAQTTAPAGARPLAGRARSAIATASNSDSKTTEMRNKAAINQRVQEMETTVGRMHALLKQMQYSAALKNSKDAMTKANLEMWGLMVHQLDKQSDQLKVAAREREDLDARRAAMYKLAEERAAQAARNAQQARANSTAASSAGANLQVAPTQAPQAAPPPESSSSH